MKNVLYINGNPQKESVSYSRRVGDYYKAQRVKNTDDQVQVFDVYEEHVPLIDEEVLSAWGTLRSGGDFSDLSEEQQAKVARMGQILAQFKEAHEYVFVTPLWNFSITPMLKAYIDNVMIAGETFKYSAEGPVGLLQGKKATVILASGGIYSQGPAAVMDHGVSYLQTVLSFLGIEDLNVIRIEGVAVPGRSDDERLGDAYRAVDDQLDVELVQ